MTFTLDFKLGLQLDPVCGVPAPNALHAESGVDLAGFQGDSVAVVQSVVQRLMVTKDLVRAGLLENRIAYVVGLRFDDPEVVPVGLCDRLWGCYLEICVILWHSVSLNALIPYYVCCFRWSAANYRQEEDRYTNIKDYRES